MDARAFFRFEHVVRRFRVSGLIVRQFTRRGPVWKLEDRVQIGVARSKRSETHWFSRPRLIDRLPLPLDWPSHTSDVSNRGRRCLSASRVRSLVNPTLCHQRPGDPSCTVRQRYRDDEAGFFLQHAPEPGPFPSGAPLYPYERGRLPAVMDL